MRWEELGILEMMVLPTLGEEHWLLAVEAADAILIGGGNGGYLSYLFQESGLAQRLPGLLRDKVYFGISVGSEIGCDHRVAVSLDVCCVVTV